MERGILTGTVIERQIDPESDEFKYVVKGRTIAGDPIAVVGKFSPANKLVIITVYAG